MALRAPRKPPKSPHVETASEDVEHPNSPGVVWLTPLEACLDCDAYARRRLEMSADEFELRWDRGDFADEFDFPEPIYVSMMRCERPPEAVDT